MNSEKLHRGGSVYRLSNNAGFWKNYESHADGPECILAGGALEFIYNKYANFVYLHFIR